MRTSRKAYIVVVTDKDAVVVSVVAFTNNYAATMYQQQYEDRPTQAKLFVKYMDDGREWRALS